ncbi:hypothetical protein PCASD_23816 [Puccinia coronata f. sp. avenae]|uniref:Uncharacterized protein n=1 Tax=Puccinia coronata f. sp. avenae TaxID=200324 RepID=A0A2N5SFB7_9BASI|nr:hypothetical protein PCASD_23816 [Puccinia coronata f. sp. avenae]
MPLPLGRSIPEHAMSFPLRSRTGRLHQRPRYMAKRPLLTIQIPTQIDRIGAKEERAQEVSFFSPFTPESSRSESALSTGRHETTPEDAHPLDALDDSDGQSILNLMMEDEDDADNPQTMSRFRARWSRCFQHGCLQPIFHQAQRTPLRRKRLSTVPAISFSAVESNPNSHSDFNLPNFRRTSNPFDYLSSRRRSKIDTPISQSHDKTPTLLNIQPAVQIHSPLEILDGCATPKSTSAPWSSITC